MVTPWWSLPPWESTWRVLLSRINDIEPIVRLLAEQSTIPTEVAQDAMAQQLLILFSRRTSPWFLDKKEAIVFFSLSLSEQQVEQRNRRSTCDKYSQLFDYLRFDLHSDWWNWSGTLRALYPLSNRRAGKRLVPQYRIRGSIFVPHPGHSLLDWTQQLRGTNDTKTMRKWESEMFLPRL